MNLFTVVRPPPGKVSNMEVYQSQFQSIVYNEETSTLEFHWKDGTEEIGKSSLKQEIINQTKFVKLYNPVRCLLNTKHFLCQVSGDFQEWIDNKIAKKIMTSDIAKMAFVMNTKSYTQISISQIIDERISRNFNSQIFDCEEKAKDWLNEL